MNEENGRRLTMNAEEDVRRLPMNTEEKVFFTKYFGIQNYFIHPASLLCTSLTYYLDRYRYIFQTLLKNEFRKKHWIDRKGRNRDIVSNFKLQQSSLILQGIFFLQTSKTHTHKAKQKMICEYFFTYN